VSQLNGGILHLRQVSRTHMAAYLCIASNGVPPSVSKRITLDVEFAPQMHVPNQLVGAPESTDVELECFVEAHPKAITYWEHRDAMVMNTSRLITHTHHDHYKITMKLSIHDLQDSDFGMYKCISKNSIAETDGSITLNKTYRPTTPSYVRLRRPGHYYAEEDARNEEEEERKRRVEEEEERRREEVERRRAQDAERQRPEPYNNNNNNNINNNNNNLQNRVTTAPGGGVSGGGAGRVSPLPSLAILMLLLLLLMPLPLLRCSSLLS
ncbi:hypothetical protein Pmani_031631, partial [Petrolisthes manimaculis]